MSRVVVRVMHHLPVLVAGLLAGCSAPLPTTASYTGVDYTVEMPIQQMIRFYRVHVPARGSGPAMPVILAFHGSSQTAEQLETQTGLDSAADKAGVIVVYLQGALGAWDVTGDLAVPYGFDDIDFVNRVLDRVASDVVIDSRRVIAVGLSNGAVFVQRLACVMPGRIAGFVAVEGTLIRRLAGDCPSGPPVAALFLSGTDDQFFGINGDGALFSIDSTLDFWARRGHCRAPRVSVQLPDTARDGTVVWESGYPRCASRSVRVVLDSIVGGGHAWAGALHPPSRAVFGVTTRNLSANDAIIRFLDRIAPAN
jgi:polyhydroxybutyrate depolymerase